MSTLSKPSTVHFEDLEVPVEHLLRRTRRDLGPVKEEWLRVLIDVPDNYDATDAIREWLIENALHRWTAFSYSDPTGKAFDSYKMVVRFEDKNDAMMFKLRDGHKAYENRNG